MEDAIILSSPAVDHTPKEMWKMDRAKVHKGKARLWRLQKGIRSFDWPPSSPDLNPIEKNMAMDEK